LRFKDTYIVHTYVKSSQRQKKIKIKISEYMIQGCLKYILSILSITLLFIISRPMEKTGCHISYQHDLDFQPRTQVIVGSRVEYECRIEDTYSEPFSLCSQVWQVVDRKLDSQQALSTSSHLRNRGFFRPYNRPDYSLPVRTETP